MNLDRPIFLFDGVCVLCSRTVQFVLRHEKADTILFVPIQSETGRNLAAQFGVDPEVPDTFLFIENNVAHKKSDGVLALVAHLRGIVRLALFGRYVPRILRDAAYDLIARNRYKIFGRTSTCFVPTERLKSRFIL